MNRFLTAAMPLERLAESPLNYRSFFDEKRLAELVESIKLVGIKAPLLVRAVKDGQPWLDREADLLAADGFEIASGHRRFRAAKLAGLTEVPVIVQAMTDDEFIELLSVEIVQHEGVHPLDEAAAFRNLLKRPGYDAQVIAARIGKEPLYVQRRLSLLRLTSEAHKAFLDDAGVNLAMAQILARLTPKDQKAALERLQSKDTWRAIKSSRQLQKWVDEELMLSLKKAPFDPKDAELVPAAGVCAECPKRTGYLPELFPETTDKDMCTDRECFEAKKSAALLIQIRKQTIEQKREPLLVTSSYESKPAPHAGMPVVRMSELHKVNGGKKPGKKPECEFQRTALIVRGQDGVGQAIEVCTNKRCKVHAGRHLHEDSPKDIAAREKRQFEEKVDEGCGIAVWRALVEAYGKDPDAVARIDELRVLARIAFERFGTSETRKVMSKARTGVEETFVDLDPEAGSKLLGWIRQAGPVPLKLFIYEAAFSEFVREYGADDDAEDYPDELLRAAQRRRVDVKAVRKQVETELRAKRKEEADRAAAKLLEKKKKEERASKKTKGAAEDGE